MGIDPDFIKRAEDILDFFAVYEVLRVEVIEKFFPQSKKIFDYLIKNRRLHKSPDETYISTDPETLPDKCLIAALSVLADVFDKVKIYSRTTAPAQISFVTYSGEYYEIIYVSYGMEAMVTATLEAQLAVRGLSDNNIADIKRIVIVEDRNSMDRLSIPQTTRYALVLTNGSLAYFRGGSH